MDSRIKKWRGIAKQALLADGHWNVKVRDPRQHDFRAQQVHNMSRAARNKFASSKTPKACIYMEATRCIKKVYMNIEWEKQAL